MKKILFILKYRQAYGAKGEYISSGLYWSAKFVADMLNAEGYNAKLVQVVDNNDIDREVAQFNPDTVIIEALWVVPEKFDVLKKLHPNVRWITRLHSNTPFLASEGIAIQWIKGYVSRGVQVAVNEDRAYNDLIDSIGENLLLYLPNYYPVTKSKALPAIPQNGILNIGCFGAIRPLKNQLLQAIAAINFANDNSYALNFHINASRVEQGDNELKNLRALFAGTKHQLIEESWVTHSDFLKRLKNLNLGMLVSLSETFSIVAADMVDVGLPIVVSPEVTWASRFCKVNPTDSYAIEDGLARAFNYPKLNVWLNRKSLLRHNKQAISEWKYQF